MITRIYTGGTGVMVVDVMQPITKILLGDRKDGQGWCIAGGKSEDGETPEQCAQRELEEEFGIKTNILPRHLKGKIFAKAKMKGQPVNVISHIYQIYYKEGMPLEKSDQEFLQLRWFTAEEIFTLHNIFIPSLVVLNKYFFSENDLRAYD